VKNLLMMQERVLVVGSGSIGRRHLRNLRDLGVQQLATCDINSEQVAQLVAELDIQGYGEYQEALDKFKPQVVFVCTPPVFHVAQVLQAIRSGADVFVEKPLSNDLSGVEALIHEAKTRQRIVQVGYNLRFHPGLQMVKRLLEESAIGTVLWAKLEAAQYLPDWRPWQDYRASYTARKELGGGIILDGSHELDYLVWLLGQPSSIVCMAGRVSHLEVDVEDCATMLLRFPSGAQVDVHLDFVQRQYSRSCKLVGEEGTIIWDYPTNQVQVYRSHTKSWEVIDYPFQANEMYVAEVNHFLNCVRERTVPLVNLTQAAVVLQIALSAKMSAEHGRMEWFEW
jgi:predicted dehydrogenase